LPRLQRQNKILIDNVAKVLPVDWTVLMEGGSGLDGRVALYETPNWAKGFDVVIHNECYANVDDQKVFVYRVESLGNRGDGRGAAQELQ